MSQPEVLPNDDALRRRLSRAPSNAETEPPKQQPHSHQKEPIDIKQDKSQEKEKEKEKEQDNTMFRDIAIACFCWIVFWNGPWKFGWYLLPVLCIFRKTRIVIHLTTFLILASVSGAGCYGQRIGDRNSVFLLTFALYTAVLWIIQYWSKKLLFWAYPKYMIPTYYWLRTSYNVHHSRIKLFLWIWFIWFSLCVLVGFTALYQLGIDDPALLTEPIPATKTPDGADVLWLACTGWYCWYIKVFAFDFGITPVMLAVYVPIKFAQYCMDEIPELFMGRLPRLCFIISRFVVGIWVVTISPVLEKMWDLAGKVWTNLVAKVF